MGRQKEGRMGLTPPPPPPPKKNNLQQNIHGTCITILKQITIPLISQSLIQNQTITNEKVMTNRIIETAKDIITNQMDLNINPNDIEIIDEDANSSTTSDSEYTSDDSQNHIETQNSNDYV